MWRICFKRSPQATSLRSAAEAIQPFLKTGLPRLRLAMTLRNKGFTLLELLIVLAILAFVITIASSPDLENGNAKASFTNTLDNVQKELSSLRNEAMMRSTTTRMVIAVSGGVYTITTYYAPSPVTSCSASGSWNTLSTAHTLNVHSTYQLTGTSAMAGTCFYRDGSASDINQASPSFTLALKIANPGFGLKQAVVSVIMATGFVDVVEGGS